jgi:hypothetical protein
MTLIPEEYHNQIKALPDDISELVKITQSLLVHIFWAERYGLKLEDARQSEVNLRKVSEKLPRLFELDSAPLTTPRLLERRLVCNCRDISTLFVSILRLKGIPARARCGFGVYFLPEHYEDHWVVEYWNTSQKRWVMLDAQLDDIQKETLKIAFNTLDMPAGQFITGGQAWQLVRRGQANPDDFGIFDYHGLEFIRGNVIRDLLSLLKTETLPWDCWGMLNQSASLTQTDLEAYNALSDQAAGLCNHHEVNLDSLLAFYKANPILHIPAEWL